MNNVSYPDIFFGLKGGFNNFGIVTKFTMRTVPQTLVYGGLLFYSPLTSSLFIQATANFQTNNKDPKAQILSTFIIAPGQYVLLCFIFYDALTAPSNTFAEFTQIPSGGSLQTLPYLSYVQLAPVSQSANLR